MVRAEIAPRFSSNHDAACIFRVIYVSRLIPSNSSASAHARARSERRSE